MAKQEPRKLTFHKTMRVYPDGVKAHHFQKGDTHDELHPGLQNGWFDRLIEDGDATLGDAKAAAQAAEDAAALRDKSQSHDQSHVAPGGLSREQTETREAADLKDLEAERVKEEKHASRPGPKEVK